MNASMAAALPRPAGPPARLGSPLRAAFRLALYLTLTGALIPVQAVAVMLGSPIAVRLPLIYHRLCWRVLGLTIECRGALSPRRPTLFVSNHSSYLDITVLGGLIPGSFVAKAEVADWPLFGLLARLQRTIFVDRQRRTTSRQRDDLARRLQAGGNLILFPEGTSDDGNRLLPFRSALFGVAERGPAADGAPLAVQPVSLVYTRLNGIPIGHGLRPFFAWYGEMALAGHLWRLAGLGRVTVVVEFHPPVGLDAFGSRKALAAHCQHRTAEGMARAIAGRAPLSDEGPAAGAGREGSARPSPAAPRTPLKAPGRWTL